MQVLVAEHQLHQQMESRHTSSSGGFHNLGCSWSWPTFLHLEAFSSFIWTFPASFQLPLERRWKVKEEA